MQTQQEGPDQNPSVPFEDRPLTPDMDPDKSSARSHLIGVHEELLDIRTAQGRRVFEEYIREVCKLERQRDAVIADAKRERDEARRKQRGQEKEAYRLVMNIRSKLSQQSKFSDILHRSVSIYF